MKSSYNVGDTWHTEQTGLDLSLHVQCTWHFVVWLESVEPNGFEVWKCHIYRIYPGSDTRHNVYEDWHPSKGNAIRFAQGWMSKPRPRFKKVKKL